MIGQLKKDLGNLADSRKAKILQKFFKTSDGEYGAGDIFLGIKVPEQRRIAKKYYEMGLDDLSSLIGGKFHEYRMVALLILVDKYKKDKSAEKRKQIVNFYLKNTKWINNWDLVDLSCHYIIGDWLLDKDRKILYELARSENLWEKRIAIISTYAFIRRDEFEDTLKISKLLLGDEHDLIHKAVGWMLREVGKRDRKTEEKFLKKHYKKMPRTMLRYAIEKFPEELRQKYLKGEI